MTYRYDEAITPHCSKCGDVLPGDTSFVIKTNDGRIYTQMKWMMDNVKCPVCRDKLGSPKYTRLKVI